MELRLADDQDGSLARGVRELCQRIADAGGRALAVGGAVRDSLLGCAATDIDVEVFGLAPDRVGALLGGPLAASEVGRSFPIFRLHRLPIDVSFPRVAGDRAQWDPGAGPTEAALRRDFTCNAIACDPLSGELVDPLGGASDLAEGRLRHASDRFGEDPLRVYRAMQLVARFELDVEPDTLARCRDLIGAELPRERVFGEWRRLLLDGRTPSRGLAFLRDAGGLSELPELEALIDCPQDPTWHPEGCVWTHTLHCLDAFAEERLGTGREDLVVGLAVLCHDLGKPATTRVRDGRLTAYDHEHAGVAPTRALLGRWTRESRLIDEVTPLVARHLAPVQLHGGGAGAAAVRRLAKAVGRIDRLVRVARADQRGRPPLVVDSFEAGDWLLARAEELGVLEAPPPPLVRGRDLIELGLRPGPAFGPLLDACYQAQLDGRIRTRDEGLAFAREAE